MLLEIFDVEHGQCALLTTAQNGHILIDCGTNTTTNWTPTKELLQRGVTSIDRLVITNCDADHASDLKNIRENFQIKALYRNGSLTSDNLYQQKSLGGMSTGISQLCEMLETYNSPLEPNPLVDSIVFSTFCHTYGVEFDDENSLSLALFFTIGNATFCFNGDMTAQAWRALLPKPGFCDLLRNVDIFMASHHGRVDGCCEELYTQGGLYPELTVISDCGIQHATQDTVAWYGQRTKGVQFDAGIRKVLTTRSDGGIEFSAGHTGVVSVNFF